MRFTFVALLAGLATASAASKATAQARLQAQVDAENKAASSGEDQPWFPLKSSNSFLCATVHHNVKTDEHEVIQRPCQGSGADGQMWIVRDDRQVESKDQEGKCLSAKDGRKAAGGKVVLVPCSTVLEDGEMSAGEEWTRLEFVPNIRGMHQISFVAKTWSFYCFGINDFDHNVRVYGCDAKHPYQQWKFDPNQYILLPRCNQGDFPEEQVRCGDMVYLYQANSKSVSYIREIKGNDNDIGTYANLPDRKAWELVCLTGEVGDRVFSDQQFCLKQNHRYLTLDANQRWTQNKYCGGYHSDMESIHVKVPLKENEQNMVIKATDDQKNEDAHDSNKNGVMYACRDRKGVMRNHVSFTGVANGFLQEPSAWMKVGADRRVSTTVSDKHAETRIFLLPPGY
jgi:hypothetical protein